MATKILKNANKFNDIKLAKGIILASDNLHHTKFRINSGISTNYIKNMIKLTSGTAIFKDFLSEEFRNINNIRAINELLVYELCKQTNVACAKYAPATIDEKTGLVSYNVAKKNEKVITLCDLLDTLDLSVREYFSISHIGDLLDIAAANGYKIQNKQQIMHELYKMIVIDNLTMQTDRNLGNIHFIVDNEKNLKSCPIIDNEFAFAGKVLGFNSRNDMSNEDFFDYFSLCKSSILSTKFPLYTGPDFFDGMVKLNVEYAFLSRDKQFRRDLYNILKNIDINKAVENVEKLGYEINADYKNFVKEVVKNAKHDYIKTYNAYKCIFDNAMDKQG